MEKCIFASQTIHSMRHIAVFILCLLCQSAVAADIVLQDSLLQQLARTTNPKHKVDILRNLADIYFEMPLERNYLIQLVTEARKTDNQEMLVDGLGDLSYSFIKDNKLDSARHYMEELKQIPINSAVACWQTYLNMRLFDSEVTKGDGSEAINKELKRLTDNAKKNKDVFEKIENAYIIASSLEAQQKYEEAIPYCLTALHLAAALPFKESIYIRMSIMRTTTNIYINAEKFDKVTSLKEEYIALQEEHYQQYLRKKRPFYPIESFRITDYTTLIINIRHLSAQKANFYLQSIIDLSRKTNRPKDKYNCFLAINNYYLFKKDYPKALVANDSLIEYAKVMAPYILPTLYNVNSQVYEVMGQYKEALHALKSSYATQDSLITDKSMEQLNKLQVQYDLEKLNFEKSQLEIKNKQIMLISMSIVLLVSIFVSAYLYRNLKREKAMKVRLRLLKTKAEESEKMKTTFINSICHEIRTPLNSIVGFTDLIFNSSIDEETRKSFPIEIQKNTVQLTGLINSMLEVSNLDVSDEELPCEPTDINDICQREMDRIKEQGKAGIRFHLHIPETPIVVATNEMYLSLVIENLLNNANKFTTNGNVTLECSTNQASNSLQISVTDTGCGIPPEKQEEVFARFTKLDNFVPGNGLGLYLCRLIVKRLSGEISADAAYTEGTRIVVQLPVR